MISHHTLKRARIKDSRYGILLLEYFELLLSEPLWQRSQPAPTPTPHHFRSLQLPQAPQCSRWCLVQLPQWLPVCNTLGVKRASTFHLMSIIFMTSCIRIIPTFHSERNEVSFHVVLQLIEIHHV